jgi:DNA-directed RNA polymerase subunit M/transcription elongation factor TFIIS
MKEEQVVHKDMNTPALFKKCPSCGKRFEVKHTSETVETKERLIPEQKEYLEPAGLAAAYPIPPRRPDEVPVTQVEEDIEEETFFETYTCTHCGHVWTETKEKVKDRGEVNDAKGDV